KPFTSTRTLLAASLIATLSACGGSNTYQLGGSVVGLTQDGLVLSNGSNTLAVSAGASGYLFPDKLKYGAVFDVQIKTQPAHQTCGINGAKGSAGTTSSTAGLVSCSLNTNTIGGTISGLTAAGLKLTNGGDTQEIAANSTTFTMSRVPYGIAYGVTVLQQPTGKTCSVSSGIGTMGDVAITNIVVSCV
ncbi:MAG: hypothetical protein RL748_1003, partial [Pseudomonadota bacterium]